MDIADLIPQLLKLIIKCAPLKFGQVHIPISEIKSLRFDVLPIDDVDEDAGFGVITSVTK